MVSIDKQHADGCKRPQTNAEKRNVKETLLPVKRNVKWLLREVTEI